MGMIGVVLGTSEGREILKRLNGFTEDIFVTTATQYGGDILKEYRYRVLNTEPMDKEGFKKVIKEQDIEVFLDSTHPYAVQVSRNIIEACKECGILYLRYERKSVSQQFGCEPLVSIIDGYGGLESALEGVQGNILNTTGSRNISKFTSLQIENRIIHRVLPTLKVMEEMVEEGIQPHDLIMIKGPISYDLNRAFYQEYDIKCVVMKDSGIAGGTLEKIKSALELGISVLIIKKENMEYPNKFNSIEECVEEIRKRWKSES